MHEARALLSVEDVSLAYDGREVLRNVSFSLGQGAFCGLIGSNGSGKTSLMRSILGLETSQTGIVLVAGERGLHGDVGYVPQKLQLDVDLPLRARDMVALGLDGHKFGLSWPRAKRRRLVDEMLAAVNALDFADQRVGALSGGQQQRVLIAHALIRRPKLLLLDEPLANLDLRAVAEIVTLLRGLSHEHGVTVLVSAHDMNPLLGSMDRIVYLAHGKAVSGTPSEVVRTEVLSALYGYHIDVIRVHGRVLVVAAGAADELPLVRGPHPDNSVDEHPEHVAAIP
ncbi:MAG: metal ABC transporter ATP-binding protein [Acidocella sp.]|nr:metal ABC transporter ATP-binding protein [Acidocella sp.]